MSSPPVRNHVLVVDDDPYFRELIELVLGSRNIPVLQAADCCEGIRVLKQHADIVKVVLLDYFMPGITPIACAEEMKKVAGSDVSIILVTASVDPAARAAELKIPRWMSKPVDMESLLSTVR